MYDELNVGYRDERERLSWPSFVNTADETLPVMQYTALLKTII